MRLTVKERILLHLLESGHPADDVEVPAALTQEGVARGAGIELRHLIQFVRPLIREGHVRERTAHVTGRRQRMKVYDLTPPGRTAAIRLREKVKTQVVRIRDGDAVREGSLHQALQGMGTKTSLLEAIRQVQQAGVLDLEIARRPAESNYVEQTWDAPRIGTFVGRRGELGAVLREDGGPQIFVIRGVAGIGKTVFAAKVCELLRGRRNLFWHRIRPWESDQTLLASLGRFLETLDRPGLSSVLKRGQAGLIPEVLRQDLPDTHAVLVFDDAHEASADALGFFRMLAEAIAPAPDVRILILTRRFLPFYDVREIAIKGIVREIELRGLESDEAALLLAAGGDSAKLAGLGRRLAGHPLFIDLVRSHHYDIPGAVTDVERFIEEVIHRGLSEVEKTTMKAASLYRVPVPKQTLLSIPGCSYETLVALQDRSLIRFVGGDRYEIHDTIRGFFEGVLTSEERQAFGRLALAHLRELAGQASASRDLIACVACLSNALRIAESSEDRRALYEALGDTNERLGDVLGLSTAYREALRLTKNPEIVARLHRKLASALVDRGYLAAAGEEVEAGFEILGSVESVEHGWLDYVRARIAEENYEFDDVARHSERALRTFERFRESSGRARALHESGQAAMWTGAVSDDGVPLAELYYEAALELAKTLEDPVFEARIRIAAATAILYKSGDYEEGMKHLRAVEASPEAMSDLNICALVHVRRSWFAGALRMDLSAAQMELAEAERAARKSHNAISLADIRWEFGVTAAQQGRYGEAAQIIEEAGSELARHGSTGFAADAYFCAAVFHLAARDWEGYQRVHSALRSAKFARVLENQLDRPAIIRPLDALIRGDLESFEAGFARILREAEAAPVHSVWHAAILWQDHFYCSVAMRALGREREAESHRRRALELVRALRNLRDAHLIESGYGNRIAETIRSRMRAA